MASQMNAAANDSDSVTPIASPMTLSTLRWRTKRCPESSDRLVALRDGGILSVADPRQVLSVGPRPKSA